MSHTWRHTTLKLQVLPWIRDSTAILQTSDISLGSTLSAVWTLAKIQQLPFAFIIGSNSLFLANMQLVCPEQLQRLSLLVFQ